MMVRSKTWVPHEIDLDIFLFNWISFVYSKSSCIRKIKLDYYIAAQHHQDITGAAGENPHECNMDLLAAASPTRIAGAFMQR